MEPQRASELLSAKITEALDSLQALILRAQVIAEELRSAEGLREHLAEHLEPTEVGNIAMDDEPRFTLDAIQEENAPRHVVWKGDVDWRLRAPAVSDYFATGDPYVLGPVVVEGTSPTGFDGCHLTSWTAKAWETWS